MEVNDAQRSAGAQATLDQFVVGGKIGGVKSSVEIAVDKVLPADRETECVEVVVVDEVLYLGDACIQSVSRRLQCVMMGGLLA